MIEKIFEKSPYLSYIVCCASVFDPAVMLTYNKQVIRQHIKRLLAELVDTKVLLA